MPHITLNGELYLLTGDQLTILGIVEQFKLNPTGLIAEYNGTLLRADQFAECVLSTGDTLELIQFMGGG
jgi:thiamine biosynthesis protein ThiS